MTIHMLTNSVIHKSQINFVLLLHLVGAQVLCGAIVLIQSGSAAMQIMTPPIRSTCTRALLRTVRTMPFYIFGVAQPFAAPLHPMN